MKELEEKYGFEAIMKEGWAWDDNRYDLKPRKVFCVFKLTNQNCKYPYCVVRDDRNTETFQHFSKTDPNLEKLEVGKPAYFWDEDKTTCFSYAILKSIDNTEEFGYLARNGMWYRYCSHSQPELKTT